jgi:hypothetical protein
MADMKTLVITAGDTPLPPELEQVIRRGSTSVERRRAADVPPAAAMPDADRIVFWSSTPDQAIRHLASRYGRAEMKSRTETIVWVTTTPGDTVPEVAPGELFLWPQDQDRLTMAFMTGA